MGSLPAPVLERGRGTSKVSARRLSVEWSGTASVRPRRSMIEPMRPSVCRRASRNTARSVSAVRIASGEYHACPPRVGRGSARQAAIASSLNQIVKLPRWRRLASYAAQFVTLRFCFGMWWRRAVLALNGMGSWIKSAVVLLPYPANGTSQPIRATTPHPHQVGLLFVDDEMAGHGVVARHVA